MQPALGDMPMQLFYFGKTTGFEQHIVASIYLK
jgi:hypothetical protein